jgi:hypothetical protein
VVGGPLVEEEEARMTQLDDAGGGSSAGRSRVEVGDDT